MLASVALKPQTAKPSGGYPTALPTSPRRSRAFRSFLRHRQGCRTGSEGFQSNHQPNRKSILGFRGLFCRLPDLCQLKQQSRRRYATDGFALLPHTYRFLGRQSFGCRSQAGEASRMPSPSSPVLPLKQGRPQSDRRRIAPVRTHSSGNMSALRNRGGPKALHSSFLRSPWGRSTDARTFSTLSEMVFVSCITCWLSLLYSSISR